jgi:hypothetical protein
MNSAAKPQRWDLAAPVSPASSQDLSEVADANDESLEESADTDQAFESAAVDGIGDTADLPERPTRIHEESWRPDDVPASKTAWRTPHGRQITTASRYSPKTRRIASEISPTVA